MILASAMARPVVESKWPNTATGGPSGLLPAKKVTVPDGGLPKLLVVMAANTVTCVPFGAVVGVEESAVCVAALVMRKLIGRAMLGRKLASPPYEARMVCWPIAKLSIELGFCVLPCAFSASGQRGAGICPIRTNATTKHQSRILV